MDQLAEHHWPPQQRRGYCKAAISEEAGCAMKEGNPYRPFWDQLGVEFVDSVYTGLNYDVHISNVADDWINRWVWFMHPLKFNPTYPMKAKKGIEPSISCLHEVRGDNIAFIGA